MSDVPKLRFREFSQRERGGEWSEKLLGELANIKTGNRDTQDREENGKYPFFVRSQTIERINSYSFDGEAILTAGDGVGVGKVFHYLNEKFDYHQRVYNIHNFKENVSGKYIFFYFSNKFYKRVIKLSAKNSVDSVRMDMISKMSIPLPSKQEQEKITSFLTSVDTKIEQLRKKEELLEQYKKGAMQKIFNQEIRFRADDGSEFPEWKEKKLNEIVNRYDNLRIPISSSNRISGNTPYYGANGIQDYVQGFTHEGEFILIAEDGANDLRNYPIQYVNGRIWVNNHAHVLQAKKDIANNKFLKYSFSKINMEPFLVGGGRAKLNANIMMQINTLLPCIEEQIKISNFLSSIDTKIEQVGNQLKQTKEFKKALLQQMFV